MTQSHSSPISPWMSFADPVQAGAQYVLQWLARIYPSCEENLPTATRLAVPLYDKSLNLHWKDLLDHEPVSTHLNMLNWAASQFTAEQKPYLIDACWHLLLSDYAIPSQLPAPLVILGETFGFDKAQMLSMGKAVSTTRLHDGLSGKQSLEQHSSEYLTALKISLIPRGTDSGQTWDWRNPRTWRELLRFWPIGAAVAVVLVLFFGVMSSSPSGVVETKIVAGEQTLTPTAAPIETEVEVPLESTRGPGTALPNHYLVTASFLNVRVQPATSSPILLLLPEGSIVTLLEFVGDGNWAHISVAELDGYVSAQFIAPRP